MSEPGQQEQTENLMAELRQLLDDSKSAIKREMERTPENPWLACFNTRTFILTGLIELMEMKKATTPEKLTRIRQKLETLTKKADEIKKIHGWNPPDELKQELIAELQAITK